MNRIVKEITNLIEEYQNYSNSLVKEISSKQKSEKVDTNILSKYQETYFLLYQLLIEVLFKMGLDDRVIYCHKDIFREAYSGYLIDDEKTWLEIIEIDEKITNNDNWRELLTLSSEKILLYLDRFNKLVRNISKY